MSTLGIVALMAAILLFIALLSALIAGQIGRLETGLRGWRTADGADDAMSFEVRDLEESLMALH